MSSVHTTIHTEGGEPIITRVDVHESGVASISFDYCASIFFKDRRAALGWLTRTANTLRAGGAR